MSSPALSASPHPQPQPRPTRADVRDRILQAARELFAADGYAAVSLATIARRAGFTKGAVYSNFSSKHELFSELLLQQSRWRTDAALADLTVDAGNTPDRRGFVGAAGRVLARAVVSERAWLALVAELAVAAAHDDDAKITYLDFRRRHRDALADALRNRLPEWGIDCSAADPDAAALVLQVMLTGIVVEHAVDPDGLDETVIAGVCAAVVDALIPQEQR